MERIGLTEAMKRHGAPDALFVYVRDSNAIAKTGTIAGAQRMPRGFLEFAADESSKYHNPVLRKDAEIYLLCSAGGQAALSGKTLKEMGFTNVKNIGGTGDWETAGATDGRQALLKR